MTGWLRSVLQRLVPRQRAPLPDLPTTAVDLMETAGRHRQHLAKADRALEDWKRFDGALRVSVVRKP
jgi:hypothetical protein